MNDANVVHNRADVLEQLTNLDARLAELLELELRAVATQLLTLQLRDLFAFGETFRHRLFVHLRQLRLVIERLEVGGAARHGKPYDTLGFGRKMQRVHHARPFFFIGWGLESRGMQKSRIDERGKRQRSDSL